MTGDIVAHGDERRAGPGRAVGVVVLAVLLAVGGVAVARSLDRGTPAAVPTPSPSPSASGIPLPPPDDGGNVVPDVFAAHVTVRRPPPGVLRTVLLAGGLPGFLVPSDAEVPVALGAAGGPQHALALVGWCAATRSFQDARGTLFYDADGLSYDGGADLATYEVRPHPHDPARLDVAGAPTDLTGGPRPQRRNPPRCARPLYYPSLPPRAKTVHDTAKAFRVLYGRYVATTTTRAFCAPVPLPGCAAQGWEMYDVGSLPAGDLAASYTWEGDFVVQGDPASGALTAIALPGVRLVSRTGVGASARAGIALAVTGSDGSYALRLDPDGRAGPVTYPFRRDAEVFLRNGTTGLGLPTGTPATLRAFVAGPDAAYTRLWVVLDGAGRVLRVVAE